MNEVNKDYYTPEEVAEKLDVNIITVYRYIKKCGLKANKVERHFRIYKNDFETFLKNKNK